MLKFYGKLSKSDKQYLREAAQFAMNRFFSSKEQDKIHINVRVVETHEDGWKGECVVDGKRGGIRYFTIYVVTDIMDTEVALSTLFHELVHVKQFFRNELKVYANGNSKFVGRLFKEDYDYWDLPHEIEAYGMTPGLMFKFSEYMREKQNEQAKSF